MISRQSSCFLFRGQHTLSTNILEWSKCDVTPCSLQQMKIFTGSDPILRLQSANFLHRELKIRYARYLILQKEKVVFKIRIIMLEPLRI